MTLRDASVHLVALGTGVSNGRLDRVEHILDEVAVRQHEMAARQQYHDEAFGRQDAAIKALRKAIEQDAENIRALARIAEIHNTRLDGLEGDRPE